MEEQVHKVISYFSSTCSGNSEVRAGGERGMERIEKASLANKKSVVCTLTTGTFGQLKKWLQCCLSVHRLCFRICWNV